MQALNYEASKWIMILKFINSINHKFLTKYKGVAYKLNILENA